MLNLTITEQILQTNPFGTHFVPGTPQTFQLDDASVAGLAAALSTNVTLSDAQVSAIATQIVAKLFNK